MSAETPDTTDLGVKIDHHQFTLRIGPPATTDKELKMHRRVWGTFSGVVEEGRAKTKRSDGSTEVVWLVEVDELKVEKVQDP